MYIDTVRVSDFISGLSAHQLDLTNEVMRVQVHHMCTSCISDIYACTCTTHIGYVVIMRALQGL